MKIYTYVCIEQYVSRVVIVRDIKWKLIICKLYDRLCSMLMYIYMWYRPHVYYIYSLQGA